MAKAATKFNLLIVDDLPENIKVLGNSLQKADYRISFATNGPQALQMALKNNIDLILLDIMMPGMDGFEVCRQLKQEERTRNIPIIFITAKAEKQDIVQGFECGAVDYVTKPFNPVVIKARIRTHLELKRHRDALQQLVDERTAERDKSQQQFRDLVEKSLVGIAIVQDERLVYQNPELARTISDLAGRIEARDFGFIQPDHLPQLKTAYQSIAEGRSNSTEIDIRLLAQGRADRGQEFRWFNCRASTFTYQGKQAILINLADITHTKELEKLLLNRNKMSSLGRIASGMAHEIRNPLTGITSYLYTLEQLCESQTLLPKDINLMKEIVSQLKLASHKVDAVIKRVLDFSKPTAPQMVLIDINRCLENILGLAAVTIRKAGIQVDASLAKSLPQCYGDVALIEQVFLNLIQNAARALKGVTGEKKIAIASSAVGNQICITVSDSGPGVPEELKDKIFDPFFTTNPDGSGIGLSIAQRIVTDHNGTLTVNAAKLGGALFTVSLPIEKRKFVR
jgi:signal transduction histidine kinase